MIKGRKKICLALPFASHPLSLSMRTLIENTHHKKALLAQVAFSAVVLNVAIASPSHAFDYKTSDTSLLTAQHTPFTPHTESAYQFPVVNPTGVSQGYKTFHPGVDIRAPKGHKLVAVADGTVIEVKYLKTGYGHHIRIAHAGTLSSLYAHMDTITVTVGQTVTKGQDLGTIGMTGWTTGPHLHFELHEGTSSVNPKTLLGI